jgi:hypothetical protein
MGALRIGAVDQQLAARQGAQAEVEGSDPLGEGCHQAGIARGAIRDPELGVGGKGIHQKKELVTNAGW